MNKNYTSKEQSKKLIELGIDPNTGDGYYKCIDEDLYDLVPKSYQEWSENYKGSLIRKETSVIPAWSLVGLLKLMPKVISIKAGEYSAYFYFLEWQFANDNSLRYVGNDRKCLIDIYSDHDYNYKDEIDTAVEMIVWLKENKKI